MLYDLQQVDVTLNLESNGGLLSTNWMGKDKDHHFWVWYHDEAISNVISLGKIHKSGKFHVTYDFDKGIFTLKNLETGQATIFYMNEMGLHVTPLNPQAVSMLTTVEDNKALYTKRQIAGAEKARALYQVIGYPSLRDFLHLLQTNQIKNCPVTAEDVKICQKIYGPDVYALKGKTVRHKPRAVVNDYLEIPRELISAHQGIILFADVMFIDGVPMMVTLSKNVRLITITYIPLRDKDTLLWALDDVFRKYNMSGFEIKEFHADPEFQCVTKELEDNGITCNICAAEEHVPDIERIIRVIKERYRAMYHAAPFSMWTKLMVIRGAANVAKWLNTFPPSGGISPTYSPRSIITGRPLDYDKHCKISFGSYVEATTQNTPTNTLEERTITGILLNTLDNIQGGYEVLNLKTGKPITRHHVKELPLTPDIIARVEHLAKRDGFKPHAEPIFRTYALIAGVGESHDSEDITLSDDDYEWQDQDDISIESLESVDEQELLDLANEIDLTPGVQQPITQPVQQQPQQQEQEPTNIDNQSTSPTNVSDNHQQDAPENGHEVTWYDNQIPEPLRRSERVVKPPQNYEPSFHGQKYEGTSHLITQFHEPERTLEYEPHEATILAQSFAQTYSLKQAINKFGEKGRMAAIEEMRQLHDREVFKPIHPNNLSEKQRRNAMSSLIFITEKRDGRIKGRTVADGSKQRNWISKEEASSPTVALESVILSAIIDAKEEREVAIVDIPNAFVQTENEKLQPHHEKDFMKIKRKLADMLCSIDPTLYGPYLTKENGMSVLYLELIRALYGMLKSSLLFYRKLRKDLEAIGFKINPYDCCVANKIVNGKQFTILWHVDDLKCSHKEKEVVDRFIEWVRSKYEDPQITKLKPSRGKVHDYLGMTLDFTQNGVVKISMKDYICKMINEFQFKQEIEALKPVTTPAADHLFDVALNSSKLDPIKKEEFHTTVAKGLFLCKRARPDLQPTIPFLCTRVQSPDVDDWKKLLRSLKYLQGTQDLELILGSGDGDILHIHWYPDAAFAVHADFKSHTGCATTLGRGSFNTISSKQKLNTRSSTEAELVAADDIAPQAIWTMNFLYEQGYQSETTVYQDNTSAMLLEKNGMESSSKRTRHINIRYYFIKDCIDKKYFKVEYCPTDDMTGDYASKPLQGHKFKKHRKAIMGN